METALQVVGLQELESRIEKGLQTFIEVGNCLLEIRDRRLYKEQGYSRFEDYCQERWGWSRERGRQLIEGAKVATIVGTDKPGRVLYSSILGRSTLTPISFSYSDTR